MKETWKIGMIGLGIMSTGITNNFIKTGNDVMVYDTNPEAVAKFADKAKVAADLAELVSSNEIICMVLPGSHVVEPVVGQMLEIGVEGKIIIDFSTSYPLSTQMLYGKVKAAGGQYCDISMSGSPIGAAEGTFDLLFGGDPEMYEALKPAIGKICKQFYNCGGSGQGNNCKLFTNYLSATEVVLFGEIFALAEKMGFDTKLLHEINTEGDCNSSFYQFVAPKMVGKEYTPAFSLDYCIKDLGYLKRMLEEFKANSLVLDGALNTFKEGHMLGYGSHDCSEAHRVSLFNLGLEP